MEVDRFLIVAMEDDKKEKNEAELGFVDVMKSLKQMKSEEQIAFDESMLALNANLTEIKQVAVDQGKS